MGGEHIVVIPDAVAASQDRRARWRTRDLTDEQWGKLTTGTDELGRRILDEYGLQVQFHSHADTHVGYQPEIERFLATPTPTTSTSVWTPGTWPTTAATAWS